MKGQGIDCKMIFN